MSSRRKGACGLVLALACAGFSAADASAAWTAPASKSEAPPELRMTAREAVSRAVRTPAVREERAKRAPVVRGNAVYDIVAKRWQVDFSRRGQLIARVEIDDRSGAVLGAWTGEDIEWQMARGIPGQFGRKLNAPYVWLPLCLLFLAPFFDLRRPFRMLHLDLLVILGFGISHIYFNRGDIWTSVPLAYPVLAYLLGRALWIAFRPRPQPGPLIPHVPVVALMIGLAFLLTFRIALNVADSGVTDVGYAGVIGADRIVRGDPLYGGRFPESNPFGNTYGPVNYLAYIPFELAFPWSGRWDELPAAHAATIAFDLLTVLGLFLLGRRLRAGREGSALGLALAFAWAACPYTTFVMQSNTNDALVALLLVYALVLFSHPQGRGAFVGLAGAAKLAPFVLVPLAAGRLRRRALATFALCGGLVVLATTVPFLVGVSLEDVWDRTLGAQLRRESPFSIWGQEPALEWLHRLTQVGLAGLALVAAARPRSPSVAQTAALAAAVMVALEITLNHWFYFYILWFLPFLLVALFAQHRTAGEAAINPARSG